MTAKKRKINIVEEALSAEKLAELDKAGYSALDAWNERVVRECLFQLRIDPWDYLAYLRANLKETKLRVTLRGQALLGSAHFSDEITEAFIAAVAERGADIIRVYDALNDPRNLEVSVRAVKKYGAHAQAAMIYAESPVYSAAFFAGYAAQLASMGADSIAICGLTDSGAASQLVKAIKNASPLTLTVSAVSDEICGIALEAGADTVELCKKNITLADIGEEAERIRAEAGYPPLAAPITNIIYNQALNNIASLTEERYGNVSDEFRDLILGKFGRTPAPIDRDFSRKICGDDPLVLVRPADLIEPDYDDMRARITCYYESEEDILTYAVFGEETVAFFEYRKAKKYSIDLPHADRVRGIHTV